MCSQLGAGIAMVRQTRVVHSSARDTGVFILIQLGAVAKSLVGVVLRQTMHPCVVHCREKMSAEIPELDDDQLQQIYSWIDEIPLSRPKRNIARDFSDGGASTHHSVEPVGGGGRDGRGTTIGMRLAYASILLSALTIVFARTRFPLSAHEMQRWLLGQTVFSTSLDCRWRSVPYLNVYQQFYACIFFCTCIFFVSSVSE